MMGWVRDWLKTPAQREKEAREEKERLEKERRKQEQLEAERRAKKRQKEKERRQRKQVKEAPQRARNQFKNQLQHRLKHWRSEATLTKPLIEDFKMDQQYRYRKQFRLAEAEPMAYAQVSNDQKLAYLEQLYEDLFAQMKMYGVSIKSDWPTWEEKVEAAFAALDQRLNQKATGPQTKQVLKYFPAMYRDYLSQKRAEFIRYLESRKNWLLMEYKSTKIGLEGEALVNETLDKHSNLMNLKNIRLEVDGHSIENDNIILSRRGIFALEVKNQGLSGRFRIVIERDGRWLRRYADGRQEVMKNVNSQLMHHIAYLDQLINRRLKTTLDNFIEVQGVIVIANDRVTIENHSTNQVVLRKSDVYSYIQQFPVIYEAKQLNQIKQILMSRNLPPLTYDVFDFREEFAVVVKQYADEMARWDQFFKLVRKDYQKVEEADRQAAQ